MENKDLRRLSKYYFGSSIVLTVLFPIAYSIYVVGSQKGEIMGLYFMVGIYSIFSIIVYSSYFAIPSFTQKWERYATLLLPSIILGVASFVSLFFLSIAIFNLVWNLILCCHLYRNTRMTSNGYFS